MMKDLSPKNVLKYIQRKEPWTIIEIRYTPNSNDKYHIGEDHDDRQSILPNYISWMITMKAGQCQFLWNIKLADLRANIKMDHRKLHYYAMLEYRYLFL